jgi:uncharacterized protein
MCLTASQIEAIKQVAANYFGADAQVWLFGSRVDNTKKGGDIDLYVRPMVSDAMQLAGARFAFMARLKQRIGDQKLICCCSGQGVRNCPYTCRRNSRG